MAEKIGGILRITVDGEEYAGQGNFEYNLGLPKNEMVIGTSTPVGFKAVPQSAYIMGEVTFYQATDVVALTEIKSATVILEHPNGTSLVLREAVYTGEGEGSTEQGAFKFRFDSKYPMEVL